MKLCGMPGPGIRENMCVVPFGGACTFKSCKAWAYTKDAFDYWAKQLRNRLDEISGQKKSQIRHSTEVTEGHYRT